MNRKKHRLQAAVDYVESIGEQQSDPEVWQRLNRVLSLGIAMLLFAYLAGTFWPKMEHLREVDRQVAGLSAQVTELQAKRDQLRRENTWLTTDPGYLEVRARDRLNLKRVGETIYQVAD